MKDAIREDVLGQIACFTQLVQATFDPERYPRPSDGESFDEELARLESEFEGLKKVFHDYLMTSWSAEISQGLRKKDKLRG